MRSGFRLAWICRIYDRNASAVILGGFMYVVIFTKKEKFFMGHEIERFAGLNGDVVEFSHNSGKFETRDAAIDAGRRSATRLGKGNWKMKIVKQ